MHFSSVVLPEPLWPINPSDDPSSTANAMSRSAQKSSARIRPDSSRCFSELGRLAEQAEDLRDVFDLERGGHSSSAKSPESRKKSRHV